MTEEDMLKLMQVKPALQLTQGGAGIFHGEAHIQINEPFVVLETIANGKSLVELVRFRYLAANPFRELTSPRDGSAVQSTLSGAWDENPQCGFVGDFNEVCIALQERRDQGQKCKKVVAGKPGNDAGSEAKGHSGV